MNFILLIIFGGGLWVLIRLFGENSQSSVLAAALLMLAGICGVFAFRVLFDLVFPDAARDFRTVAGEEDDYE